MSFQNIFPIGDGVVRRLMTISPLLLAFSAVSVLDCRAEVPNLTKGGAIPGEARHFWNLGATGAKGWIYSDRLVTSDARQIAVTEVGKGSPAEGVLAVGDVILGVGGKPFSFDPRTEFGVGLTVAESEAGGGNLSITRWRGGDIEEVVVKLPVLGTYSATAPYSCPKSKRIFEMGCEALAKRMQEGDYARSQNAITRSLNALALLASGERKYQDLVRREASWAAEFSSNDFQTWWNAYVIMFLAEYHISTGDRSVVPGLRRLALEAAEGQSIVGSWGHRFAGDDGRLVGYGMMNAPGVPLTTSLILARKAGVKDAAIDLAIERSARLLRFYIGKGAIPYGDHNPWTETHEDNGKCGMTAVMFNFMEEEKGAEFFSRMSVASHGAERDTGHTGNFTNMLWAMPGVALSGPQATGAWIEEFGAWYFDFLRTWEFQFPHAGPPDMTTDSYRGWDATGGYLLAYAMPLKNILLTGKKPSVVTQLDAEGAAELIMDGRGWSNKHRNDAYDKLTPDQLLERLGSWSPTVRERSAAGLQRLRGDKPVEVLIEMLKSPDIHVRYGACAALKQLRGEAAPAIAALKEQLNHEDLWLRVVAAEALANIGPAAISAVPVLLERLAVGPTAEDPRGMEQRYLAYSLFDGRRGLLAQSLDQVDRDVLYKAVRAGLQNEDGRARGSISSIYGRLSFEEIKVLLPAIHRAVVEPAPSGIMFADEVRVKGLELLAKHRLAEGMQALVDYTSSQNKWASEKRTPQLMEILMSYGAHAKEVVPDLERIASEIDKGEENFPGHLSKQKAANIRETISKIESATELPELNSLD